MRLTAMLLLSACLMASARGTSQTVTLSAKEASLEKVFKEIKKQTGYDFWYESKFLENTKKVSVELRGASLEQTLQICFKDQPLTYIIIERTIVVKPKQISPNADATAGNTVLPPIDIKGRVVDETGMPVVATVQVKGTNKATPTNENGEFELRDVDDNATIVISATNIEAKEIKLNGKTNLDVVRVKMKVTAMNEVVVNKGYYTTTEQLNTGNVGRVTSKEIEKQPVNNPILALVNRVPGLLITQPNGVPGAAVKVELRGRTSLQTTIPNDPLFIIDGVPFGPNNNSINQVGSSTMVAGLSPFFSINPADIETIEVLKDADATAIYGSRGANGVILITTKKGKPGSLKIDANVSTAWSKATRLLPFLNTQQYVALRKEAFANDGIIPNATAGTAGYAPDLMVWDTTRYTDLQKLLMGGTANTIDGQLSVSGGSTQTQFLVSGGYYRETAMYAGSLPNTRGSFHSTINHATQNKKFNLALKTMYSVANNKNPSYNLGNFVATLSPNVPSFYDANGKLNWQEGGVAFENPFAYLKRQYNSQTDNFISNLQLGYEVIRGLNLKSSIGYNLLSVNDFTTIPIASQNPANNPTGTSNFGNSLMKSFIVEPQLEYTCSFLKKAKYNLLVAGSWQFNKTSGSTIIASGFTDDALLLSPSAAPSISLTVNSTNNYVSKYASILGRMNFNWDSKYLLNLTARRDGSSRFGPGKQFANFGSISAGWLFNKEKVIAHALPFLSYGKLRASYGSSGNDKIGEYMFLDTYGSLASTYQGLSGLTPSRLYNPDYAWEINYKAELAAELGFLRDRILFTGSYYRNRSSNELINYRLATQTGGSSILANFPATVQNTGLELELNTKPIQSKKLNWTASFNITLPNNKLLEFPNFEASSYTYLEIGKPLSTVGGYKLLGVDPATGVYVFEDKNGKQTFSPVSADRFRSVGNFEAKFYGGLRNDLEYKGFELSVFFDFKKQTGYSPFGSLYYRGLQPGRMFNMPTFILDRWQHAGDITEIQKVSTQTSTPAGLAHNIVRLSTVDRYFGDASFARLKNLSLSYKLDENTLRYLHLKMVRIYVSGQNLFTLTHYLGGDPETQDVYMAPPLKTISLGLQVTL